MIIPDINVSNSKKALEKLTGSFKIIGRETFQKVEINLNFLEENQNDIPLIFKSKDDVDVLCVKFPLSKKDSLLKVNILKMLRIAGFFDINIKNILNNDEVCITLNKKTY